jgi:hypothetical protein
LQPLDQRGDLCALTFLDGQELVEPLGCHVPENGFLDETAQVIRGDSVKLDRLSR